MIIVPRTEAIIVEIDLTSAARQEGCLSQGRIHYPYRFKRGTKQGLVIVFNGWDPYKVYRGRASFNRWKELQGLDYSVLYFSQPSIGETKVSHSIGVLLRGVLQEKNYLLGFIKAVRDGLKLKNKSLIFYGKSSGCTAAFLLAQMFRKSSLLLANPETNPLAHDDNLKQIVASKLKGVLPRGLSVLSNKANLVASVNKYNWLPHIYIFQSAVDVEYLKPQAQPLIDTISSALGTGCSGGLTVEYCFDPLGHKSDMDSRHIGQVFAMQLSKAYRQSAAAAASVSRTIYVRQINIDCRLYINFRRTHEQYQFGDIALQIGYSDGVEEELDVRFGRTKDFSVVLESKEGRPVSSVELSLSCGADFDFLCIDINEEIHSLDYLIGGAVAPREVDLD